ncbi:MAG: SufD family Fe-S cluster assembly protein [Tenericutes bacterium]|nr:SufD family Fe-S cluster assembly protein [Mycoplasmatota bacterium]
MKTPTYLNDKSQVILLRQDEVTNKSDFEINDLKIKFKGTESVYLYIEDFNKKDMTFDFLENSKIKLYIIVRSSKQTEYNFLLNVKSQSNIDVFTGLRNKDNVSVSINRTTNVAKSATIHLNNAIVNMGHTYINEFVHLNEEKASVNINQLNIGSYNDLTNVNQDIFHNAKHTISNIENWLISNSNSKLNYSVSGRIFKGNEFSSCSQSNKGIILKELGEIEVEPKLFIDEYNVEASHGAAIGQMDDEQLYYLLSRGLTELQAKSLIISGYTLPFINSIQDEDIQQLVERQIHKKITEVDAL